jgi:hypothetical protein
MSRILLIANKNWEVEPILNAILNATIRDPKLPLPDKLNYPWTFAPGSAQPRAVWSSLIKGSIELWCVQDIMDPKWNSSSSQGKHEDLPKILQYSQDQVALVLALGTASSPTEDNINGCVVMGSNVFIHNYHPNGTNPESVWDDPAHFEKLVTSTVPDEAFSLAGATLQAAQKSLLRPFLHSSEKIKVLVNKNYVALGSVNITNYAEYSLADPAAMEAFKKAGIFAPAGSVETTHGVIRLMCDAPFMFMSGITDRFQHFNDDVDGTDSDGNVKTTAQNYSAAFNIGVALSNVLMTIVKAV